MKGSHAADLRVVFGIPRVSGNMTGWMESFKAAHAPRSSTARTQHSKERPPIPLQATSRFSR
jgi:hypothetical protein